MARIIPLKIDVEPPGPDTTNLQGGAGEPAQIILFPGVRYERWHEQHDATPSQPPAPADRAIRRDWLDI